MSLNSTHNSFKYWKCPYKLLWLCGRVFSTMRDYKLTPPTFSKNPPWPPKWMSCSLKNQVNLSSRDGSWLTWQGRTTLSPTVTSSVDGWVVMMVGSENTQSYPCMFGQTRDSVPLFQALPVQEMAFQKKPSPSIILMDMSDSVNRRIYGTEHTAN